ncbi:MAG TPA: hypothetical protein VJ201_06875 [Candidatus Babeliales bacterium]|nr:hypothetical protein [Candidatus Babeliales bacterium]
MKNKSSSKVYASYLLIIGLLAGCGVEQNIGSKHQSRLERAYRDISFEYDEELTLMRESTNEKNLARSLHERILVSNDKYQRRYPNSEFAEFPYLQYSRQLDDDINRLENAIMKSTLAEDELQDKSRKILKQLRKIKKAVVVCDQFQTEKKQKAKVDAQYAVARATDRVAIATAFSGPRTQNVHVNNVEVKKTDINLNL